MPQRQLRHPPPLCCHPAARLCCHPAARLCCHPAARLCCHPTARLCCHPAAQRRDLLLLQPQSRPSITSTAPWTSRWSPSSCAWSRPASASTPPFSPPCPRAWPSTWTLSPSASIHSLARQSGPNRPEQRDQPTASTSTPPSSSATSSSTK